MKAVLEPLAQIPGVRAAMLILPDGVPIVARSAEEGASGLADVDDSLAALASGWLGEIARGMAPLGWTTPERLVLRAARGTLILRSAPSSMLLVILDRGASSDDVRLPMEAAVARLERLLRGVRRRQGEPPAPLPSVQLNPNQEVDTGPTSSTVDRGFGPQAR